MSNTQDAQPRFTRIKSLLSGDKIDSHTISLVIAECDSAALAAPQAEPRPAGPRSRKFAFDQGWRMASEWANRPDLIADMDSPQYDKERTDWLSAATPPPVQPQGEHVKDCATCAHQTLPAYAPKCQRCSRLATGARRNWEPQGEGTKP